MVEDDSVRLALSELNDTVANNAIGTEEAIDRVASFAIQRIGELERQRRQQVNATFLIIFYLITHSLWGTIAAAVVLNAILFFYTEARIARTEDAMTDYLARTKLQQPDIGDILY